jgi:hypothetical protein
MCSHYNSMSVTVTSKIFLFQVTHKQRASLLYAPFNHPYNSDLIFNILYLELH